MGRLDLFFFGHAITLEGMDLLKKTRTIYDSLDGYFGAWLDGERSLLEGEEPRRPFERADDVENLGSRIPAGRASGVARLDSIFVALSSYYEAGFDLRFRDGEWYVRGTFLYGRSFASGDWRRAPFEPPVVPQGGVVRGRGAPVVRAFRLDSLESLRESSAFVFDIGSGVRFVLLSERPRPWVDLHIERTRRVLDGILGLSGLPEFGR